MLTALTPGGGSGALSTAIGRGITRISQCAGVIFPGLGQDIIAEIRRSGAGRRHQVFHGGHSRASGRHGGDGATSERSPVDQSGPLSQSGTTARLMPLAASGSSRTHIAGGDNRLPPLIFSYDIVYRDEAGESIQVCALTRLPRWDIISGALTRRHRRGAADCRRRAIWAARCFI